MIYLQPIGGIDRTTVEQLRAFAEAIFAVETRTLPPLAPHLRR